MDQRCYFAIFFSRIVFGAAFTPHDKVAPFVSLGQLRGGSHSHYCMATVVARDEAIVHSGPTRLFAITTDQCSKRVGNLPSRHAQFEGGPAEVLGWVKSDLLKWKIDGQHFDLGEWTRVSVVMLQQGEGFEGALTLAGWKSVTVAEQFQRETGLNAETEALQNHHIDAAAILVADWNEETGRLTTTKATIVPIEQCFPGLDYRQPLMDLYKQHFICVQTSEHIQFPFGAPLHKVTGDLYTLLGIRIASNHPKERLHVFLNVRAYTETFEGLIGQLQEPGGMPSGSTVN